MNLTISIKKSYELWFFWRLKTNIIRIFYHTKDFTLGVKCKSALFNYIQYHMIHSLHIPFLTSWKVYFVYWRVTWLLKNVLNKRISTRGYCYNAHSIVLFEQSSHIVCIYHISVSKYTPELYFRRRYIRNRVASWRGTYFFDRFSVHWIFYEPNS